MAIATCAGAGSEAGSGAAAGAESEVRAENEAGSGVRVAAKSGAAAATGTSAATGSGGGGYEAAMGIWIGTMVETGIDATGTGEQQGLKWRLYPKQLWLELWRQKLGLVQWWPCLVL